MASRRYHPWRPRPFGSVGPRRPEPVPLASGIDQVASLAVGEASVFAVVGGPKLNNVVVRLSRRTLSDAVLGSLQPDEPEVLTADDGVVGAVSVPRPVSFSVAPRRVAGGRDPVATAHGLLYLPNPAIDREVGAARRNDPRRTDRGGRPAVQPSVSVLDAARLCAARCELSRLNGFRAPLPRGVERLVGDSGCRRLHRRRPISGGSGDCGPATARHPR